MDLILWTLVSFFLGVVTALIGIVVTNTILYERDKKLLQTRNKTFMNTYHNARKADLTIVREEEQ